MFSGHLTEGGTGAPHKMDVNIKKEQYVRKLNQYLNI